MAKLDNFLPITGIKRGKTCARTCSSPPAIKTAKFPDTALTGGPTIGQAI
jgi:hypothetical protein